MSGISGITNDILGTLIAALGAAATLFALFHALRYWGVRVPRWAMPAGIGLAMVLYATWNEYSWYDRVRAQLPERVQIISTGETRVAFRPWSYLAPMTLRFTALDPAAVREGEGGIKIAPLAVVERWAQTVTLEHGVNCAESAVRPPQGEWVRLPAGDPLVRAVCNGG